MLAANFAQAQLNVVQPTDPIIASSSNNPGSEGVANAIDGTQAKYLNFDLAGNAKPAGFVVTPAVGPTILSGIAMESANDAPERDPRSIILEGSNDTITNFASGTWTTIYVNTNVPIWNTVFPAPLSDRYQVQSFSFTNNNAYKSYRWTVVGVANPTAANSMQIAEVQLLGVTEPKNVIQPTDTIIASSSNNPGSEGVANAIDGTQAKYLNFDLAGNAKPAGFTVAPSVGATVITGIAMESANDAPERDPRSITIEGSNDSSITNLTSGTWTTIYANTNIPIWNTVFPAPLSDRYQTQTFFFPNVQPYKFYRWTVLGVANPTAANSMQIAEVQLLGTGAPVDALQPTDPIIASSSNNPGSEGVANAIDGTQAKYLNFDLAGNAKPAGFVVTPSIGATVITGIAMESANDAPERDPRSITIEGSNDTITNFASGNWTLIYANTNIPIWNTVFPAPLSDRYQVQTFYFPNNKAFKSYRWTVLGVANPTAANSMQIAEVSLLAVTASNPCGQTQFLTQPANTPVLSGNPATFLTVVNGPWSLQWYANGKAIPGATKLSYTTDPITAANATNLYSVAIVGCQTSQVVQASIFTPSSTKSIGISFVGSGANGAPTAVLPTDIMGIQPQAYWNNATNGSGTTGDSASEPDALVDSSNAASTITFTYATSGTWGSGAGTDTAVERMLNGLTLSNPGAPATYEFDNVPQGSHAVLIYVVSPPLQFQDVTYTIQGATTQTNYIRAMASGEYNLAPGFYRGSSTDPNNPTIADFVRFDGVKPDANGTILVTVLCTTTGYDRGTGVNGIQLVLNAPSPGSPPAITSNPQPTVVPPGGTAVLPVVATGAGLTYQWRKNGANLPNGGHVSGAQTATLSISSFTNTDEGVYSVAVFNQAGSVISKNAAVRISNYSISDQLVGYWKFDETSGTNAANAVASGKPAGVVGNASWGPGEVGNSFTFDGSTYMFVPSIPPASVAIAGSAWVNLLPPNSSVVIMRNGQGALGNSGGGGGQFELSIQVSAADGNPYPSVIIEAGPNRLVLTGTTPFPVGAWHHLAFSADGAQLRLYVDGVEVANADYLANLNVPSIPYLSIGAQLNVDTTQTPPPIIADPTTPNFMGGGLDELALWNRSLTASEVMALYNAGKAKAALTTVTEAPPVQNPKIAFTVSADGKTVTLTWPTGFTLQSTPSLTAPIKWTDVTSTSPLPVPIGTGNLFGRLRSN